MALIQYSALVSQMRGKLNGSVLSKSGAGQIITNRGVPRLTPSESQLAKRSGFTANAYLWEDLTEIEREAWRSLAATIPIQNRIGETVFLSGFLYFRKVMSLVYPDGGLVPFLADPIAGNAQEVSFTVTEFDAEPTAEGWNITLADFTALTINATAADQYILIGISLPISAGAVKYYGTYYRALTEEFTPPNSAGTTFFPSIINKLMPKGWFTYPGAVHRFKMQFVVPGSGSVSVEQFNDLGVTIPPEVEFPVLTITTDGGTEGMFVFDGISWLAVPVFTADSSPPGWRADYQASLSFGQPISGSTVPPGTDFGAERLQAIGGPFSGVYFFSPGPPADSQNSSLMISNAPGPYTFGVDPHSPVRIRLFHTPSGTYGPYNIGAAPIELA
jgi:hypothetical protein